MSNWYSIKMTITKHLMIQADTLDEAEDIAYCDYGDISAHTEVKTEDYFTPGDGRDVDAYINHADEVSYDDE